MRINDCRSQERGVLLELQHFHVFSDRLMGSGFLCALVAIIHEEKDLLKPTRLVLESLRSIAVGEAELG